MHVSIKHVSLMHTCMVHILILDYKYDACIFWPPGSMLDANMYDAHMGQIPQDGKNEQYVALFFNFWRFTVTKRLDFFKFSQLFWRDYVR